MREPEAAASADEEWMRSLLEGAGMAGLAPGRT